jgi:hypothetical protein
MCNTILFFWTSTMKFISMGHASTGLDVSWILTCSRMVRLGLVILRKVIVIAELQSYSLWLLLYYRFRQFWRNDPIYRWWWHCCYLLWVCLWRYWIRQLIYWGRRSRFGRSHRDMVHRRRWFPIWFYKGCNGTSWFESPVGLFNIVGGTGK